MPSVFTCPHKLSNSKYQASSFSYYAWVSTTTRPSGSYLLSWLSCYTSLPRYLYLLTSFMYASQEMPKNLSSIGKDIDMHMQWKGGSLEHNQKAWRERYWQMHDLCVTMLKEIKVMQTDILGDFQKPKTDKRDILVQRFLNYKQRSTYIKTLQRSQKLKYPNLSPVPHQLPQTPHSLLRAQSSKSPWRSKLSKQRKVVIKGKRGDALGIESTTQTNPNHQKADWHKNATMTPINRRIAFHPDQRPRTDFRNWACNWSFSAE